MALTTMASLITPARVIPSLHASHVRQVIGEMARAATVNTFLDHEEVQRAVLARGETSCFGFGRGIAVPHAMVPGLARPVGAFARLNPPQDFEAADDVPSDLVFLLLSPGGDDPTDLRTLACVVRRLRDREVAARLRSAEGVEAIHSVLTTDAWRGAEIPSEVAADMSAI
jgi:PTS system nitrogen regulatory IIA component